MVVVRRQQALQAQQFASSDHVFDSAEDLDEQMNSLSERQRTILAYIHESISTRGYPPAIREIGSAVGLASPSSVYHQLKVLEDKGLLRRDPNLPRAMEVTPGIFPDPDRAELSELRSSTIAVPLIGQIAAGQPILADEHVETVMPVPKELVGDGELFMLEVRGDSMIDAAICDGDYVVIRKQQTAHNGQIVAAMIDGEATVKVLLDKDGHRWLLPRNPSYEPIPGDEASIIGRVVAVMRRI